MTKYRIQLDLTDEELNVLSKTLNEAVGRAVFCKEEADHLLRIIEEVDAGNDIAETIE